MKRLSYKQEEQLLYFANNLQTSTSLAGEDAAFITLMRICRDYVSSDLFPLIKGTNRDEWFLERLKKYNIRFFDKI